MSTLKDLTKEVLSMADTPIVPSDTHLTQAPFTVQEMKAQVQLIQEMLQAVMQNGHHYGVIPGTEKPTLLKPGAEKLAYLFRLAPVIKKEDLQDLGNGHLTCKIIIEFIHIPTGRSWGEGIGVCSTMESRYRWRKAERLCPKCEQPAIIKGKPEYGGGYLCYGQKGGCGAKFKENDQQIIGQVVGRVENQDIYDVVNTVVKMAKKRAMVDGVLTVTAASDIFTQDLDDSIADLVPPSEEKSLRTLPKPEPAQHPIDVPRQPKAEPKKEEAMPDSRIYRGNVLSIEQQGNMGCLKLKVGATGERSLYFQADHLPEGMPTQDAWPTLKNALVETQCELVPKKSDPQTKVLILRSITGAQAPQAEDDIPSRAEDFRGNPEPTKPATEQITVTVASATYPQMLITKPDGTSEHVVLASQFTDDNAQGIVGATVKLDVEGSTPIRTVTRIEIVQPAEKKGASPEFRKLMESRRKGVDTSNQEQAAAAQ